MGWIGKRAQSWRSHARAGDEAVRCGSRLDQGLRGDAGGNRMESNPMQGDGVDGLLEAGIERRRVLASMGMMGLIGAAAGTALGQPVQGPQQPDSPSPPAKKVIRDTK